jgi:hypothetical protein
MAGMKVMSEMALRCGRGVNVGRLGLSHEKISLLGKLWQTPN